LVVKPFDETFQVNAFTESPTGETVAAGDIPRENATEYKWIRIEYADEAHPALLLSTPEAIEGLALKISLDALQRFEKVGLYLPGICADYVPKAIDEFDKSSFKGVEIEGPIGVNITALEAAGVNLTALAEKLRNDTEVDEILSRTNASTKTLGGSFILPVLNKNQYDPFSAPIVFQGSAVVVRFGIYIESMSNFQTSTMDYDMDIYLMMSWRDARLVNPYDKPILVKEEEILDKIWRPDPFFANAKEAEFHEVTFLNFLMRIFPDGLVLYETRVDAIDKNPDVKLPELYIDRYEPTVCTKARKSGAFSCLRAVFRLKRDVGFHIAQTYIPTSLALMFSWRQILSLSSETTGADEINNSQFNITISEKYFLWGGVALRLGHRQILDQETVGVWLPEEFMEGRIGVAITVLLTLSTESAGAREHLPSVSYLKKKWALKTKSDMTEDQRDMMMQKAKRYHKTGRSTR
ncbi:hypothetical protein ANCDUO_16403, partial [Ancylostoma duodenale]